MWENWIAFGALISCHNASVNASVILGEYIYRRPQIFSQLRPSCDVVWEDCPNERNEAASRHACQPVWSKDVDWVVRLPRRFSCCYPDLADLEIITYNEDLGDHSARASH